jgi:hypothetical protein
VAAASARRPSKAGAGRKLLGQRSSGTAEHSSQIDAHNTIATREEQADRERIS